MKLYTHESLEGNKVTVWAANKTEAEKVLEKVFSISGYWGFAPEKIKEVSPEELMPEVGKVMISNEVKI